MFLKEGPYIIRLNGKTAFFAALSMNIFSAFMQLIIILYSSYVGENMDDFFSELSFWPPVILFLVNMFMLYIYFRIEFWIMEHFADDVKKRWLLFFAMFLFVGILSSAVSQLSGIWYKGELTAYRFSIIWFIKDLMLFISSVFVAYLIYLIIKNQEKIEENKNLVIENFKNRYHALKNQTDPHFFFNSLNSLSGLIGYDDERAHEYLMQLSSVFRYTMQEHSVVTLPDELEFTESYIYLMKIRYGDALSVDIRIPDSLQAYYVLPFAIQTLVENAVKHNIASLQKPLRLLIAMTENETLVVENNLQPRQDVRYGNGLGLSNIDERYWLMFRKNINIESDGAVFRVEIPLIKQTDKYNDKLYNLYNL